MGLQPGRDEDRELRGGGADERGSMRLHELQRARDHESRGWLRHHGDERLADDHARRRGRARNARTPKLRRNEDLDWRNAERRSDRRHARLGDAGGERLGMEGPEVERGGDVERVAGAAVISPDLDRALEVIRRAATGPEARA